MGATPRTDPRTADFAADVRHGLARSDQRFLPSRYLYDELGSALFEAITLLPEYGLTRADRRLIERHAPELAGMLAPGAVVAELGSGSGSKTRHILSHLARRGPVDYFPIDISGAALDRCRTELQSATNVRVRPLASAYLDGLREAVRYNSAGAQTLVLFLGSTIGNFDRGAALDFLRDVRRVLRAGDILLLGTDLEKPVPQLVAAYDDTIGVTAAFNLNVLARINRDLDGHFDLNEFEHVALYDQVERRIEMHLRSRRDQEVEIGAAGLTVLFRQDETIRTEHSYKFSGPEVREMGRKSGFGCLRQWVDQEWPFAETVLEAE